MFERFMQFGNIWIDPERIVGAGFEYEKDFGATESGLVVKGGTQKLKVAIVFLDTGTAIHMDGEDGKLFQEWWHAVTAPKGDSM